MPVRFRCPHCSRLLGIARRKAGTQINCPQCGRPLTVPSQEDTFDLDEIDVLLNPSMTAPNAAASVSGAPGGSVTSWDPGQPDPNASASLPLPLPPEPEPLPELRPEPLPEPRPVPLSTVKPLSAPVPKPLPRPAPQAVAPRPVAKVPEPVRKPPTSRDAPLLERDVDSLLGLDKGGKFELDEDPQPRPKPVSGMDAMSLDAGPRGLHLSPQKATLLAVAVVVLLGIAFAAGFLVGSNVSFGS